MIECLISMTRGSETGVGVYNDNVFHYWIVIGCMITVSRQNYKWVRDTLMVASRVHSETETEKYLCDRLRDVRPFGSFVGAY